MADGAKDTILYLDRSSLYAYTGDRIVRLDFPGEALKDLEIIDKSAFDEALDKFITLNKLQPERIWTVLSESICFTKDFETSDQAKFEKDIKEFLDAVPFDQVISKRFKSSSGVSVIAANKNLVDGITDIFERKGFRVEGVTPAIIFPTVGGRRVFDEAFAKVIMGNGQLAESGNMIQKIQPERTQTNPAETNGTPAKKSKMLPYLIGVFAILIAILLVLLVLR